MTLSTKLTKSLLRTTDNYIKGLAKAGVETIGDLLMHFPRDYDDRTEVLDSFSLINIKEKNTILVKLLSINSQKTANNKLLTKAVLEDKNGFLSEAVWFNRKYLASQLKTSEQKKVIISGKVKYAFGKVTFQSPEVERDLDKLAGQVVPIYPELNYIPSKWIEGKMELIKNYIKEIPEDLPEDIIQQYNFPSKRDAIMRVHFPKNKNDIEIAQYRLAYGELFEINYKAISEKHAAFADSEGKSIGIPLNSEKVKEILAYFPFEFTNHQKIALFQVLKDMEKPHSMQRLLEGDVGTGKTAVAFVAAIHGILETSSPFEKGVRGIFPYNPELKEKARELRNNQTEAEKKLWFNFFREFEENILRQKPLLEYIVDFFIPSVGLVIEIDGDSHFETEKVKKHDEERTKKLEQKGLKVIRFTNLEVYENFESVCEQIVEDVHILKNHPNPLYKRGNNKEVAQRIQAAIMAPTEILARQHFEGMQDFLMHFGISSHLLVGSLTAKQKTSIKEDIKQGNVDIVIGTHALVQEDVFFKNLGFVVVDEQHRFGVKQRGVLEQGIGNTSGIIPHNLNMTATPIPRTLALTLYGDQDLSIISEYPKGRKEIFTKVGKNEEERLQIENFVRAEIEKGRQVFWISPLVEESEKMDLANAINTFENLQDIFHPHRVGLLHGKMKAKEKDAVMKEFQENKIQILSSTSVVEVGVNIPNATIMCIEGAERFGLSQLHQFRGRVGRGAHQSYCYLFPTKGQKTDRLKAMEQSNNGFELAEIDLELRGPGEVYGVRQSGVPDLKVASLTDLELISQIREDIEKMFTEQT